VKDDEASATRVDEPLVCIECGSESSSAERGWRAYILDVELIIYCPGCAAREFDDAD